MIIAQAAWALLAGFIVSWKYVWKIQREDENSEKPTKTLVLLTAIEINCVWNEHRISALNVSIIFSDL